MTNFRDKFQRPGAGRYAVGFSNHDYVGSPVTTAAWTELVHSTSDDIDNIEIFDGSGQSMLLGIGAAGFEVAQIIIFVGGNGQIPFHIPAGSRISIKALSANAISGISYINYYTR